MCLPSLPQQGLMYIYDWAVWLWAVASGGLLISYSFRYRVKQRREFLDILKWLGVIILIIYPIVFWRVNNRLYSAQYIIEQLTIPILAVIYLYDRWILKPETMKTKFLVVAAAQTVLILLSFIFSLFQKAVADKQLAEAIEMRQQALRYELEKIKVEKDSLVDR